MEIKTTRIKDIEMDWFSFGDGDKSFVIIPGLSLKSVMLSADAVAAAYQPLAEKYKVYVFDRRKDVDVGYAVREMALDTAQVMRSIGITNADIFGTSQGGMIAQYIAIDNTDIVHSLILGSTTSKVDSQKSGAIDEWIKLAKNHDVIGLNRSFFKYVYSADFLHANESILPIIEKEGTAEECDRFVIFAEACRSFCSYDELDKIKCPVFVIGAKQDKVLTGQASVDIAEKLGCELYMYDSDSHAVYDEAPNYKERILEFLYRL